MLSEDGALEAGPGAFSLEPFLRTGDTLLGWREATATHRLEDDALPIPSVQRRYPGGVALNVTAFADGPPERLDTAGPVSGGQQRNGRAPDHPVPRASPDAGQPAAPVPERAGRFLADPERGVGRPERGRQRRAPGRPAFGADRVRSLAARGRRDRVPAHGERFPFGGAGRRPRRIRLGGFRLGPRDPRRGLARCPRGRASRAGAPSRAAGGAAGRRRRLPGPARRVRRILAREGGSRHVRGARAGSRHRGHGAGEPGVDPGQSRRAGDPSGLAGLRALVDPRRLADLRRAPAARPLRRGARFSALVRVRSSTRAAPCPAA